jgi:small subunit ribosomal protein S17
VLAMIKQHRKTLVGEVISDKMDKTVVVEVTRYLTHPFYRKILNRRTKIHAHDEENQCRVGDIVEIAESRPVSKTKAWVVTKIVRKAL